MIGRDDRRLGAVPVAAVELRDDARVTADDLLGYAATVLARYELPTEIRIVDELPRTDSGKVALPPSPPVRERTSSDASSSGAGGGARRGPEVLRGRRGVPQGGPGVARRRGRVVRPTAAPGRLGRPTRLRHRLAEAAPRRRLRGSELAGGVRRARAARLPAARVPRGVRRRRRPLRRHQLRRQRPRRPHPHRRGHRGAAALPPAQDPLGRERLVPGLLRARRGLRPGLPAHQGGARRRRLRRHRPEDLEHPRPRRRLLRAARAHRSRRARSTRASRGSSSTCTNPASRCGR